MVASTNRFFGSHGASADLTKEGTLRFSRPSTGMILGAIAVFVALGGTAFAAGATVVNIADPTTPANVAKVDASGRLQVNGAAAVTNTVNTELAAPSAYLHSTTFAIVNSRGCLVLTQPPTNKAMIVREVRVDVFADPSPGPDEDLTIYRDSTCTSQVADVNPATVGETVLPFDPGLGIPANSGISARATGSVEAEAYVDAYSVSASSVPATPATATPPPTQRP
jgi:hypothetical protein